MKDEFAQFKKLLLSLRVRLVGKVDSMQDEALKNHASGDLSNVPIHMADVGTDNYERDLMLELIQSGEEGLRNIDTALEKIEDGTFGECETCEKKDKQGTSKGRSLRKTLYRVSKRRGSWQRLISPYEKHPYVCYYLLYVVLLSIFCQNGSFSLR